jgi:DNA-directed RNA polymerase specialized sigma24 family protein
LIWLTFGLSVLIQFMADHEQEILEFIRSTDHFRTLTLYAQMKLKEFSKNERAKSAADYAQLTLIKLYEKGCSEKIDDKMQWCKTVVWRLINTDHRQKKNNWTPLDPSHERIEDSNEYSLSQTELAAVNLCMEKKYPQSEHQEVYRLHFHLGFPIRKIIEKTGLNYNTTGNILTKMRIEIADCFKKSKRDG